ncbi:hypothetical protein NMY22_g6787 [Coprinellus aureogranulatus]|nr:hypothetical protein NMY22_g6787 [Coprinellus aureogranulatus]
MSPAPQPASGSQYRLDALDLPDKIKDMVRVLSAPSPEDRQDLMGALRGYQDAYRTVRKLQDSEGQNRNSKMNRHLHHVVYIAWFRLTACKSVVAAWRRLPVELWDKIFAFYMESSRCQVKGTVDPNIVPALPLGQDGRSTGPSLPHEIQADFAAMDFPGALQTVCHAWKTAVLSSPSIWSQIAVFMHLRHTGIGMIPFVWSIHVNRLLYRLKRIKVNPCPWSLSIGEAWSNPYVPDPSDLPVSCVFAHAEIPWDTMVSLKLVVRSYFGPYFQQLNLPSVASLVMVFNGSQHSPTALKLAHAPSLRKAVILSRVTLMGEQTPQDFLWPQLTHLLFMGKLNGLHVQGLLRLCSSLHHASFIVADVEDPSLYTPTWCHSEPGESVTLDSLEELDIIIHDGCNALDVPLVDIQFPALTSLRLFSVYASGAQLTNYLRSFASLTRLSLVASRKSTYHGHYSIIDVLDTCPLLVELVATSEGELGPLFESLAFAEDQPRGRYLRTIAILCDCGTDMNQFSGYPYYIIPVDAFESIISAAHNLTASRRRQGAPDGPAHLERLVIRLTESHNPNLILEGRLHLKRRIETTLQPFVDDGLQLSVEVLPQKLKGFKPYPSGKHWDEGALDFIDERWEYTASMPPTNSR